LLKNKLGASMKKELRDIYTLINDFASPMATSNGTPHERAKAELAAKLTSEVCAALESLDSSMRSSAKSNDTLGRKVFWLNIVLTFATSVGAIATVVMAVKGQ
jgi:hypothetical protein